MPSLEDSFAKIARHKPESLPDVPKTPYASVTAQPMPDDLAAVKGIAIGVGIGLAMWLSAFAAWWIFQ